jgi:DNA transformation protein
MPDDAFVRFLLDQLGALGDVRARRMFGGFGLYQGTRFFGIVADDTLYFKTDAATQPAYFARGMAPFQPNARQTLRNYYAVPAEIVDDRAALLAWAAAAVRCQPRPPSRPQRPAGR